MFGLVFDGPQLKLVQIPFPIRGYDIKNPSLLMVTIETSQMKLEQKSATTRGDDRGTSAEVEQINLHITGYESHDRGTSADIQTDTPYHWGSH